MCMRFRWRRRDFSLQGMWNILCVKNCNILSTTSLHICDVEVTMYIIYPHSIKCHIEPYREFLSTSPEVHTWTSTTETASLFELRSKSRKFFGENHEETIENEQKVTVQDDNPPIIPIRISMTTWSLWRYFCIVQLWYYLTSSYEQSWLCCINDIV